MTEKKTYDSDQIKDAKKLADVLISVKGESRPVFALTGTRPSFASGSCSRPHRRPGTSTRRKRQGVATAATTSQPC